MSQNNLKELLKTLIGHHTTDDDIQSRHESIDFIATYLAKRNMHIERFESNGYESFVATALLGNKQPKVMLAAHLDVVPADEELFVLREAEGRLYGRGTLDMKFAIASYMQFVDKIQDRLEDYDFGIMITTDEEQSGQDGVAKLLQEGYAPKVCIIPDGGDNWQIQVHSKGYFYFKMSRFGTPAHGSRPWLGDNAILPLIRAIQEIQTLFPDNNADSSTLNVGAIRGGAAPNQVPDYAEATLDIRVPKDSLKQELIDNLSAICDTYGLETELLANGAVTEFSLQDPYIAPFARHIHEVTGIQVTGSRTLGSNDARYFAEKGIPCISLYPAGAGHHGPEEWISEEAFYQFYDILQKYLDEVALVGSKSQSNANPVATAGLVR